MKKIFIAVAFIFSLCMSSCGNDDIIPDEPQFLTEYDKNVDSIAKIVCNIVDNKEIMQQLMIVINKNLLFGLNEEARLRDILFPQESKIIDTSKDNISLLTEAFCDAFGVVQNSQLADNMENKLIKFIYENEIEIYFPFSDSWDEQSIPTVVPTTLIQNNSTHKTPSIVVNTNITTYSKIGGNLQKSTIDVINDNLLQSKPFLAVMSDETPYDILPNFKNGEFVNQTTKTVWITRMNNSNITFGSQNTTSGWYNDPNNTYQFYISNLSVDAYDSQWVFNSSAELKIAALFETENTDGSTSIYQSPNYFIEFTKKEIKEKIEINGNYLLIENWKPHTEPSYMVIVAWEENGGKDISIPIENLNDAVLRIKDKDFFYGFSAKFEREIAFVTCKHPIGDGAITSDGFAYLTLGNATFSVKYSVNQ